MARLTEIEREALTHVCTEVLAGDAVAYFNFGYNASDPPVTPEEKHAVKLAEALVRAMHKL